MSTGIIMTTTAITTNVGYSYITTIAKQQKKENKNSSKEFLFFGRKGIHLRYVILSALDPIQPF